MPWGQLAALFCAVAAARFILLTFAFDGGDGSSVSASAARRWSEAGIAEPFPWAVSPFYQFLRVLLWPLNSWAWNLASALAVGMAATCWAALAGQARVRWVAAAALVLTFAPFMFDPAARSGPWIPALALGMAALLAAAKSRPLATGLLLGLAAASHPSALLFIPPAIVLSLGCPRFPLARNGLHTGIALGVTAILLAGVQLALWRIAGVHLTGELGGIIREMANAPAPAFSIATFAGPTGQALALVVCGIALQTFRRMTRPFRPGPPFAWNIFFAHVLLFAGAAILQTGFLPWLGNPLLLLPPLVFGALAWSERSFLLMAAIVLLISPWVALEGTRLTRGSALSPTLSDSGRKTTAPDRADRAAPIPGRRGPPPAPPSASPRPPRP